MARLDPQSLMARALAWGFVMVPAVLSGPVERPRAEPQGTSVASGYRFLLEDISDGQEIVDHDMGVVKFKAVVERVGGPGDKPTPPSIPFQENALIVSVNGREAPHAIIGQGSGKRNGVPYAMRDVAVRLGPDAGNKNIRFRLGELSVGVTIDFRPAGQFAMLGLHDGQALFGQEGREIAWLACFLTPDTAELLVNGKNAPFKISRSPFGEELWEGRAEGQLIPGPNEVHIEAADAAGERQEKNLTIFYYPRFEIPVGDAFYLRLGASGSQSGPFFRARVEGKSLLAVKNDVIGDPVVTGLGEGGFSVDRERPSLVRLRASGPGPSVVVIEQKRHFRDADWVVSRRVQATVVKKP